jgi:hypothetical protein
MISKKKYTISERRIFSPTEISGSHQCIATPCGVAPGRLALLACPERSERARLA